MFVGLIACANEHVTVPGRKCVIETLLSPVFFQCQLHSVESALWCYGLVNLRVAWS
jgi:hypothetical protein